MKQQRSREKKELMAQAAARLLLTQGPHAITHRNVAITAGLAPGSGNYYFPSKTELYAAAVTRAEEYRIEQAKLVAEQAQPTSNPHELAQLLLDVIYAPRLPNDLVGVRLVPMLDAYKDPALLNVIQSHAPHLRSAVRTAIQHATETQIDEDLADLVMMCMSSSLLYGRAIGQSDPVSYAVGQIGVLLTKLGIVPAPINDDAPGSSAGNSSSTDNSSSDVRASEQVGVTTRKA